jgi:hypothetical protein
LQLTFIQLEIWPTKANANELELNSSINYGLVPLNEDGSININISSSSTMMDINLTKIGGKDAIYNNFREGAALAVSEIHTN